MKKKFRKVTKSKQISRPIDPNRYPKGWDRKRVNAVISHYENQSDEQAIAEDEAAYDSITSTMMQVPLSLVAKVEKLIARASASLQLNCVLRYPWRHVKEDVWLFRTRWSSD